MAAKGIKICGFAALNLSSDNRLNSWSKRAVLAVILVSAGNSRQEWWIHQRFIKDFSGQKQNKPVYSFEMFTFIMKPTWSWSPEGRQLCDV